MELLKYIDSYFVRGLFILPLGAFGVMHFIVPEFFLYMVPSYMPGQFLWVILSGVALTAASLSIFLKIFHLQASFLLILFVITFILSVDIPMIYNGIDTHYFAIGLLKDTSLLGGSVFYFVIFKFLADQKKKESAQKV